MTRRDTLIRHPTVLRRNCPIVVARLARKARGHNVSNSTRTPLHAAVADLRNAALTMALGVLWSTFGPACVAREGDQEQNKLVVDQLLISCNAYRWW